MSENDRANQRQLWLAEQLGADFSIAPLAGDASFRCYYRIHTAGRQLVLMDAPPEHEDVRPFLAVRTWLESAGLRVSRLEAENMQLGFLLLEDFGDRLWSHAVADDSEMQPLFEDALRQLHRLQASTAPCALPLFDVARMQRECDLYLDWYLPYVASTTPTQAERNQLHSALLSSLDTIAALPRVAVHLDYHSRNLMLPGDTLPLGIIDYQDAVIGPVTYDLASLLYDCYQDYPESVRRHWSREFYQTLPEHLSTDFPDFEAWHRALRLTALQRHIKAIGIFARLAHRDGKQQFLREIPLTRKHLQEEMQALMMGPADFPLLGIGPNG